MSFSIADAAFEGFRLARERPRAILTWAAFLLAASLVTGVLVVEMAGPQMTILAAIGPNPSQAQAMAIAGPLGKLAAALTPLVLLIVSVLGCAVFRVVLSPAEGGPTYMKFGLDELRMAGVVVLLFAILFASLFAAAFGVGAVAVLVQAAGPAAEGLVSVFGFAAMICVAIWVMVRLSLAAPMAFVARRLNLSDAWRLTRGHFWRLAACYLLAIVFGVIVWVLGLIIATALGVVVGGGMQATRDIFYPNFNSLGGYFSPVRLGYTVIAAVIGAMLYAIVLSPLAVAYRDLAKDVAAFKAFE